MKRRELRRKLSRLVRQAGERELLCRGYAWELQRRSDTVLRLEREIRTLRAGRPEVRHCGGCEDCWALAPRVEPA